MAYLGIPSDPPPCGVHPLGPSPILSSVTLVPLSTFCNPRRHVLGHAFCALHRVGPLRSPCEAAHRFRARCTVRLPRAAGRCWRQSTDELKTRGSHLAPPAGRPWHSELTCRNLGSKSSRRHWHGRHGVVAARASQRRDKRGVTDQSIRPRPRAGRRGLGSDWATTPFMFPSRSSPQPDASWQEAPWRILRPTRGVVTATLLS